MPKLEPTKVTVTGEFVGLEKALQSHLEMACEALEMDMLDMASCCVYGKKAAWVIEISFEDLDEKESAKKALRKFINSHKVKAAVLTARGLFRDVIDPDKVTGETIIVLGRDAYQYRLATREFVKHLDGSIEFKPVEFSDVDEFSSPNGWFNGCKFIE